MQAPMQHTHICHSQTATGKDMIRQVSGSWHLLFPFSELSSTYLKFMKRTMYVLCLINNRVSAQLTKHFIHEEESKWKLGCVILKQIDKYLNKSLCNPLLEIQINTTISDKREYLQCKLKQPGDFKQTSAGS